MIELSPLATWTLLGVGAFLSLGALVLTGMIAVRKRDHR